MSNFKIITESINLVSLEELLKLTNLNLPIILKVVLNLKFGLLAFTKEERKMFVLSSLLINQSLILLLWSERMLLLVLMSLLTLGEGTQNANNFTITGSIIKQNLQMEVMIWLTVLKAFGICLREIFIPTLLWEQALYKSS